MNYIEEFEKLKKKFPRPAQIGNGLENCEWGDHIFSSNNCYYAFDGAELSDCLYSYNDWKGTACIDTLWNGFCERCYETSDCGECSDCYYCQYCGQSYNMYYSFYCASCHDCFGCTHLSNKSFCIFNVQYTEEEYNTKLAELKKLPSEEVLAKVKELQKKFPQIQSNFRDNENSEYVDYVYKSQNAYYCFDGNSLEDCGYLSNCNESKDSWDGSFSIKVEHCCNTIDDNECYNCYETQDCNRCYDSAFLYNCTDTNNCLLCCNLSNTKYCILNVQYTKEEYEIKLAEIKNALGFEFKEAINQA